MAGKRGFNSRLDQSDALGILYAVQSEETYALLVEEQGWTSQQWRDWATRTVLTEFFPERGAHRSDPARPRAKAQPAGSADGCMAPARDEVKAE